MSAAVNDRPHDVLASRAHLPLTGEFHPLRREFERLLAAGNIVALTFAMLACTLVSFWPREADIRVPIDRLVDPGVFPSPPPIAPEGGGAPGLPAITPDIDHALIEPVDKDELVQETTPPETTPGDGTGETGDAPYDGPIGPIDPGSITLPDPPASASEFNWWDEAPVMLSCDPPVYPAIVREAGIDGPVHVRVLIGVNGKVKVATVVDGPAALRDAALVSARTAIFKPALQGVHPVEVWVVMPITFQLHQNH